MRISVTSRVSVLASILTGVGLALCGCLLSQRVLAGTPWPVSAGSTTLPIPLKICQVQGNSNVTPYFGKLVRVQGVVYADLDETGKHGFFMQHENCDSKSATSDGIFVYIGLTKQNIVRSGDSVVVTGTAQEYYGKTEIATLPVSITVLSSGNPLPDAVDLAPPFNNAAAKSYFETLEGMLVEVDDARVVGPTSVSDESWVVRNDLGLSRVFQDDPQGTGEIICVDEDGLFEIVPEVKVGDRVQGLSGALDFSLGIFRMQLIAEPVVLTTSQLLHTPIMRTSSALTFTVATMNLFDLFDTVNDPNTDDKVLNPTEYARKLKKRALALHDILTEPDLIAVQEVETSTVLVDLVNQPEIYAGYDYVWEDGPDLRGIDVALLYRTDRVLILEHQSLQGCTTLQDGLGPDGNGEVYSPTNTLTCDSDGNGTLEGNRLFSRPPLLVRLKVCPMSCGMTLGEAVGELELWLVVNHWKSKTEDSSSVQYTLPRRLQEAQFVADLVQDIHVDTPDVPIVVLGDLNDFPNSQPISVLKAAGMVDLISWEPPSGRFSYNYHGVSQVLDYILYTPAHAISPSAVDYLPINSDYPAVFDSQNETFIRSSDHDPALVTFIVPDYFSYLPLVLLKGY